MDLTVYLPGGERITHFEAGGRRWESKKKKYPKKSEERQGPTGTRTCLEKEKLREGKEKVLEEEKVGAREEKKTVWDLKPPQIKGKIE